LFNVGVRDLCQKLNEYKGRRLNDVLSVDMFGDIPNYKVKDFHLMPPVGVGREFILLSSSLASPALTLFFALRTSFRRSSGLASWEESSWQESTLE
jgi:hypothetical protein